MSEILLTIAVQSPIVAALLWFLIHQERSRQDAITRNHAEWGERWRQIGQETQDREDGRQQRWLQHLEQWQRWSNEREDRQREEWARSREVMLKMEGRLEHLSTIVLLVYAAVQAPHIVDDIRKVVGDIELNEK